MHNVRGQTSSKFSITVGDSYRNKQGKRVDKTTYFDCAYWLSANVARLLTKGTLVELTGGQA